MALALLIPFILVFVFTLVESCKILADKILNKIMKYMENRK